MNAFISEEGQLPIFQGDIDQHGISGVRFFHFQPGENLYRPVNWIHKTAMTLHEYTDLSARPLLSSLYGFYNPLFFSLSKKFFPAKKWNVQCRKFMMKKYPAATGK
jgi:hypothetical protein